MIVSSRSWHIAHTASSSLLIKEDDDGHFLSFVLMCVDIVGCELARTAQFGSGHFVAWCLELIFVFKFLQNFD